MTLESIERRVAPRFPVNGTGDFVAATSCLDIQMSDISLIGCGIEADGLIEDMIGRFALINIHSKYSPSGKLMLPVTICNMRPLGSGIRYGLKFRSLDRLQTRGLMQILENANGDEIVI